VVTVVSVVTVEPAAKEVRYSAKAEVAVTAAMGVSPAMVATVPLGTQVFRTAAVVATEAIPVRLA
jgi:hypothetical protein